MEDREEFLTARQLAKVLQVSESTVRRLARKRRIPSDGFSRGDDPPDPACNVRKPCGRVAVRVEVRWFVGVRSVRGFVPSW